MASGIYEITNQVNGKRYIGSALNLRKRRREHFSVLRRGQHRNRYLQRAFTKYGEEAFDFTVLEHLEDSSQLIPREQHYLDTLNPEYNISPTAGSSLGVRHTEKARRNMSIAHMGHCPSVETRRKMSDARRGERHHMFGKTLGVEHRAKLSRAHTGKRNYWFGKQLSAEHRAKIGRANRGKSPSPEARRKMSIARKGKRLSEGTRQKISKAQKAYWRRLRAAKKENRHECSQ